MRKSHRKVIIFIQCIIISNMFMKIYNVYIFYTNYCIIQRKLYGIKYKQGCIPDGVFFRSQMLRGFVLNRKVRRVHWSQKFSFSLSFYCFRCTEPMGQTEPLAEARESTCNYGTQQGKRGMRSSVMCCSLEEREKQLHSAHSYLNRKRPADQLIHTWIRYAAKLAGKVSV